MKLSTQIKPISYLKSHAATIIKEISESKEPLIVTQNGEAKLVVMDIESYERWEQTQALLKILALGQREIEKGKYSDALEFLDSLEEPE